MKFKIADFIIELKGAELECAIRGVDGFQHFFLKDSLSECNDFAQFEYACNPPQCLKTEYNFIYQDVNVQGSFGVTERGYRLDLIPLDEEPLSLWSDGRDRFYLCGNLKPDLLRFAIWVGFGIYMSDKMGVAIHSSAILYKEQVVLFLGESGTGKSTHTRLWRESILGASLLNDDSPILRYIDGKIWVYGSPWSGKTPCYRNERYELAGCVRLSQAPHNKIQKLSIIHSYGAMHPSAPPQFAYNVALYDGISATLGKILEAVPVYHLECLPDFQAAELSCRTIFGE